MESEIDEHKILRNQSAGYRETQVLIEDPEFEMEELEQAIAVTKGNCTLGPDNLPGLIIKRVM